MWLFPAAGKILNSPSGVPSADLTHPARTASGTIPRPMTHTENDSGSPVEPDFEALVNLFYRPLYQFAFSLSHSESDACDLTQQTFFLWATRGHQLRDRSKVKTWLFTTLHREFLAGRRRQTRFPHQEFEEAETELPTVPPVSLSGVDTALVLQSLAKVPDPYRAALVMFYMDDFAYREIAEVLGVPLGTVQSRIARGLAHLQRLLQETKHRPSSKGKTTHE
jgi:RNA polymerase sigma-70 factor (ECF subfamily)